MTKPAWKLLAGVVSMLSLLGAYVMQPDNLALFSNPKLVAFLVGGAMVVLTFLNNWLPSLLGTTAGESLPPRG